MFPILLLCFGLQVLVPVYGVDNKVLLAESPLFGICFLAQNSTNASLCHQELKHLLEDVQQRRVWALKVLDASGRPDSGFYYGNNFWLGSHSQCADLANTRPIEVSWDRVKRPNATPYDFPPYPVGFFVTHMDHNNTMQYHTQMPLEFTIQLGLCAPKSCSPEELKPLLNKYIAEKHLLAQSLLDLHLNLTDIRSLEDNVLWLALLPKTQLLLVVLLFVFGLAIIGTCYDVRKHNRTSNLIVGQQGNNSGKHLGNASHVELVSNSSTEEKTTSFFGEFLKCFSVYTNAKNLMRTKLPADSIPVVHGIKFFSMLWVILVHAVFFQSDYTDNVPTAFRLSEDIFAQILSNSTYCVDSFLFISGFLVGYLFFKSKQGKEEEQVNYLKKISEFFMMFLNRFLRLTPPYLFVLLCTDVMYTYYRHTSALTSSERNDVLCAKYWWRNVLYINNLYPRAEMCMSWSWYLSVDTQFFAITTFLLIVSTIAFKVAAVGVFLLIIINISATAYQSYSIGYIPTMDEQLRQLDAIYDLPWNRMGPYLVGVITAYILIVKLDKQLILTKRRKTIYWTFFPLINIWILFTLYTRNLSVGFSAFYMGVSRTLWGVGMGWLVIACCTGNAGVLAKFLAFKGWIPLSRFTYCAFLLNPLLANMIYMGTENPLNASLASYGLSTLGVTYTSYVLAFALSLFVESPCILLTKIMFNKITCRKPSLESGKA